VPRCRIPELKLPLDHGREDIERRILTLLRTSPENLESFRLDRKSFDARDKGDIRVVYGVTATLRKALRESSGRGWTTATPEEPYRFPAPAEPSREEGRPRPVVVGAGPAGLFCALLLAENGYRPLVLERGGDVRTRAEAVRRFWETGELDPECNMQFGEGGAGTFSDGKLNTGVHDRPAAMRKVLAEFVEAGAPPEIAWLAKPHIGTDYLVTVVRSLREKILRLGGEVRFGARVSSLEVRDGRIRSVTVNGTERIDADRVVLAVGHSARDVFEELERVGAVLEPKPFAMGLRIEHPQEDIQRAQFGASWSHPALPRADYKLTHQARDGRGVYSFCMCPGGWVVNAASEAGGVVCNGMSDFARDSRNANSALVVAVRPGDFGGSGPRAGVEFQRAWEAAAFRAGGGDFSLPVQTLGDFVEGRPTARLGAVKPCIRGRYRVSDLSVCLPAFVRDGIREALGTFGHRIRSFDRTDAILSGVETRTSSPVRVLRNEALESGIAGLFPCGEGAGYAGGILSAAVDGVRAAESVTSCNRRTSFGD
jgi:hypothetical protein